MRRAQRPGHLFLSADDTPGVHRCPGCIQELHVLHSCSWPIRIRLYFRSATGEENKDERLGTHQRRGDKKDSQRRAEGVRCRLETEIFSGALTPGERLDEMGLARRFGVSRTPVREALLQLSSAGLIEMRPRQGAVVAAITVQQLLQMFEVMAEMEALCARYAARRMGPDERQALERGAHKACIAGSDRDPSDTTRPTGFFTK